MTSHILISFAITSLVSLHAQQSSITAITEVGVRVAQGTTVITDKDAAGTIYTTVRRFGAKIPLAAEAAAQLIPRETGVEFAAGFSQHWSNPGGNASIPPLSLDWTLTGQAMGSITIEMQTGGSFTVGVDVGRDGVYEFGPTSVAGRLVIPTTLAGSVSSRIDISGASRGALKGESMILRANFWRDLKPPLAVSFGAGCGTKLRFDYRRFPTLHQLAFTQTSAPVNQPAVFWIGLQKQNVPIPNTGCVWLVQPIATVATSTNVAGNSSFVVKVPGPIRAGPIYVQAAALDLGSIPKMSNGVSLTLVD